MSGPDSVGSAHAGCHALPVAWPVPPFNVVLVEPEIPPNTGTIARLCAATGSRLHLVGPLGFRLTDRRLRRAGLDYWEGVDLVRHPDLAVCLQATAAGRTYYFSTRGTRPYTAAAYRPGDFLVFGSESRGLPPEVLATAPEHVLALPIQAPAVRSLNLATAVAIVLYEALRQHNEGARSP